MKHTQPITTDKLVEEALTGIWLAVDALVNLGDKAQASNHLLQALGDITDLRKVINND